MMNELTIKQSTGVIEEVTFLVLQKLYELITTDNIVNSSVVEGRLHCDVTYRYVEEYLKNHFNNLYISVDNYAIPFEDQNALTYLNQLGVGNNGYVTEVLAAALSDLPFTKGNETVTKFNELKYFTKITSSKGGIGGTLSGECSFAEWTALLKVDISNFTSIGHSGLNSWEDTFKGCTSLQTVTASDKLTDLGYCAFESCPNLESITGLLGTITLYRGYLFEGDTKLDSNSFKDVEFILNNSACVFLDCKALLEITLSSTEQSYLGQAVFKNCTNLTKINNSNMLRCKSGTTMYEAFRNCSSLQSLDLSNFNFSSVNQLYHTRSMFRDCRSLTSLGITTFSGLKYIGSYMFTNCTSLAGDLIFPDVTQLDTEQYGGNFSKCQNITSIAFSKLTGLNGGSQYSQDVRSTFGYCTSLRMIDLGSAITNITPFNFAGCTNLSTVIIRSTTPPTIGSSYDITTMFGNTGVTIYVPDESLQEYKSADGFSNFADNIVGISTYSEI